ncbi:MAG TPA: hypothetical protein VFR81_25795 [Longimicrobium sp.]|nr:hypothetical protein [Longimicrobium sp.]
MRRQRIAPLFCALALALAAALPASAQQASLKGTWRYDASASDNVAQAINTAVQRMNFVTRPIARGRLTRTNQPYQRVTVDFTSSQVTVTTDGRDPIVSPANGTPIKWTREDKEVLDVSTEWENGVLEQTFKAEDGQRVNRYSVGADGRMTMEVTITSPRLPRPLTYKLIYNRAS